MLFLLSVILLYTNMYTNMYTNDLNNNMYNAKNWINIVYNLENRDTIKNISYINNIKKLHFSIARFPGGEISDNYNWKKNSMYIEYKHTVLKPIDFDTFMYWKQQLWIKDVIIVVNLEQWFIEWNIEKYADLAASWVRYANKIKHYNIKYWEIWNESYLKWTKYSISADDYVKAIKLYSIKMKREDPSIKIWVWGPTSINWYGFIDKLNSKDIFYLSNLNKIKRRYYLKSHKFNLINRKWKEWWNVLKKVDKYFDFLSLHTYIKDRKELKKDLINISKLKKLYFKKDIFITEYSYSKHCKLNKKEKSKLLKAIITSYLNNKNIKIINYWPLRYNNSERELINNDFNYSRNWSILRNIIKQLDF